MEKRLPLYFIKKVGPLDFATNTEINELACSKKSQQYAQALDFHSLISEREAFSQTTRRTIHYEEGIWAGFLIAIAKGNASRSGMSCSYRERPFVVSRCF